MRVLAAASILLLVSAFPTYSLAAAEGDIIGQCLEDNADEGQTTDAVATYCACANEKMMQDNYGKDIDSSEWEKMNADGQEACSKEAGWVSRPD
ncbi:hypothetical protein IHQ71_12250 [Rhizobium sp. TH2]|uniref:hypothetical protein n=1 Tax=Rhizobium sp. TH2 TaxID=2775403 RepID=UPI00215807B7|nr:hypothetical protein [Rhizobium sp. TH2]UVC11273.1 hypothetical protein IHQ71_12250 [Rhizobium sp. TH2]